MDYIVEDVVSLCVFYMCVCVEREAELWGCVGLVCEAA